jgi:hemerythrin-like domain-containing protein
MHAVFKLLIQEHKEAKKDLSLILENKDDFDFQLINKLCDALTRHMDMEERYLYPVIAKKRALKEQAEEAELEHDAARKLIKEIQGKKLDDVEYKVKLEMLQLDIEHHVEEEETEVFPNIEEHFSKEQLDSICDNMKAFKEQAELTTSTK